MRVQILSERPAAPGVTATNGLPNMVPCLGMNGLTAFIAGVGTVNVHVFIEGRWRLHPNGQGIVDDDSFARLVTGDDIAFACLVADGVVPDATKGFLSACER